MRVDPNPTMKGISPLIRRETSTLSRSLFPSPLLLVLENQLSSWQELFFWLVYGIAASRLCPHMAEGVKGVGGGGLARRRGGEGEGGIESERVCWALFL